MAGDDDYEIPESGAVFTFGRSRFAENLSSHFFIRNDSVIEISCGDEHTALVCQSGRVFLFGHNDYGQLGFGHIKTVNKPSCLKYLKPFHSTHVACGKGHTVVSTACARIFAFGCNSDGQLGTGDLDNRVVPQMIPTGLSDETNIIAVGAGCHHSAFLTDKGDVYLWGCNSDGQCGVADNPYVSTPQKLEFGQPISSMACGYYHTAFISLGCVYAFGEEDNGKLGRLNKTPQHLVEKVPMTEKCTLVRCGGSHTMILTEKGLVYALGSNFSGQLGIGNSEAECLSPTLVEFPHESDKVVYMSCGESHTAFLTEKGVLYTCGDSRHGKLCNDDESSNVTTPTLITMFENYFCTFVSCGGCHTMVLAKVRETENNTDVIFSQSNKTALPPLKTQEFLHLTTTSDEIKINDEEVIKTEQMQNGEMQNGDDNEECDTKSNTESHLNNEEITSHTDEIYTEIEEIKEKKEELNVADLDIKSVSSPNEANENDMVVVRSENPIKKLLNVFKRKKSVSAILLNERPEERGNDKVHIENKFKSGNQKSKTCIIL